MSSFSMLPCDIVQQLCLENGTVNKGRQEFFVETVKGCSQSTANGAWNLHSKCYHP